MQTYRTAQIAAMMGVHPNTVRLYESSGLIPKARREANGYRVFNDLHLAVFKLARTAFEIEVLQNGLRKKVVQLVKAAAAGEFDRALHLTAQYLSQVQAEQANVREAISITQQILSGIPSRSEVSLKRQEAAACLQISVDTLRNWEMNGLLTVSRRQNGYRVYTEQDIARLKMIRSLRCANYSLESIRHMLCVLSADPYADIAQTLDNPPPDGDILTSVYDKLLTSLARAEKNACIMRDMLHEMQRKF